MKRLPKLIFSGWLILASVAYGQFKVPRLTSTVMDHAKLMSPRAAQQLRDTLLRLAQSGGSQITVITVPTLEGTSIEQAGIQLADAWKLGTEEKDNGVIVLVAKQERKIRIEVGQGNEGVLTDAHSKRIIDEVMVPLFKEGSFSDGILLGVAAIVQHTDPQFNLSKTFPTTSRRRRSGGALVFFFNLLLLIIIIAFRGGWLGAFLLSGVMGYRVGRHRGRFGDGGGFHSGGGGSFGGGGFSGGGGGFSGGGASGGW